MSFVPGARATTVLRGHTMGLVVTTWAHYGISAYCLVPRSSDLGTIILRRLLSMVRLLVIVDSSFTILRFIDGGLINISFICVSSPASSSPDFV